MKKLFVALLVVMIGGTLVVGIAYAYTHTLLNKDAARASTARWFN